MSDKLQAERERNSALEEAAKICESQRFMTLNPLEPCAEARVAAMKECARDLADFIRWRKSTPASPSQPSSVAMTAALEAALLQSPPKGASTGTEREQHDKWFYSEYPQADRIPKGEHRMSLNGWVAGRSLSSPQEASKPQDDIELFEAEMLKRGWRIDKQPTRNDEYMSEIVNGALIGWKACASQPSAASGRELPQSVLDFDDFLNMPPEYEDMRMVREYRHAAYPKWNKVVDDIRAAPTGAAPADANVGEILQSLQSITPDMIDAAAIANRDNNGSYGQIYLAMLKVALAAPTAPEPSAPADKDAEPSRADFEQRYVAACGWDTTQPTDAFHRYQSGSYARYPIQAAWEIYCDLTGFDAAVDRMRSEDGGKTNG